MNLTANIYIWNEFVGAVVWEEREQTAYFEYAPEFIPKKWELSPIKMPLHSTKRIFSFPEHKNNNSFKGLPGLLADILPDRYGNRLINEWLARQGRSENSFNPVELLCFIGTRGMGALEFEPAIFPSNKRTLSIALDSLVEATRNMLDSRKQFTTSLSKEEETAMREILRIGTSAGGARPKAIIAYNEKTNEIRSGQTTAPKGFTHWLIKLDGVHDAQFGTSHGYGRVEMAYYHMALDCGIEMMESRLLEENGRAHFMTKRFDRENDGQRHHIQTLCALQHYDFNDIFSYSYEQLFQTMRLLRLPFPQVEQMFRRMVFNVLARNCDDHTKNVSFRLKKDQPWELAPAYDVCHAYRPGSEWVSQHALSINGKRTHITKEDLLSLAKAIHIKKAPDIIEQLNKVVSRWPNYAEEVKVVPPLRDAITKTLIRFK